MESMIDGLGFYVFFHGVFFYLFMVNVLGGEQKVKMEGSASIIVTDEIGLQARKHCWKGRTADE